MAPEPRHEDAHVVVARAGSSDRDLAARTGADGRTHITAGWDSAAVDDDLDEERARPGRPDRR